MGSRIEQISVLHVFRYRKYLYSRRTSCAIRLHGGILPLNFKRISKRFFIFANNSESYLSAKVEVFILTHKESIPESRLFKEYVILTLEIFRIFIFTMTDSSKNDSGSMKPLLTKLLNDAIIVMKTQRSGMLYDKLMDFMMNLKINIIDSRKVEFSDDDVLRFISSTGQSPKLMKKTVSNLFSNQLKEQSDSKKSVNLISVFRKTMYDKAKFENVIVSEVNEILRKSFKEIMNQKYFEKYAEDEFQELQYNEKKDRHSEVSVQHLKRFEGFLKGIINHIQPENQIGKNIQLLGLHILMSYIIFYKADENPSERNRRQQFMFSCELDKLLCKLVSTSNDHEIVFYSLSTAQQLLVKANHDEQLSFMASIMANSFSFLHTPLVFIKDYLMRLENDLLNQQKYNLLLTMFGEVDPQEDVDTSDHVKYRDSICSYFVFLRSMCEGRNVSVQDFLRAQNSNDSRGEKVRTINIFYDACDYLKTITRFINKLSIQIIIDILRLLTECILGPCVKSQQELLSYNIVDNIREILSEMNLQDVEGLRIKGFEPNDEEANLLLDKCFDSIIELFLALIESNTKKSLLQDIAGVLPFEVFILRLTKAFRNSLPKTVTSRAAYYDSHDVEQIIQMFTKPIFSEQMQIAFNLFYLITIIGDKCMFYQSDIDELQGEEKLAFDFFTFSTQSIEVIFRGAILKQYFVKYPACHYFSDKRMVQFMNTVKRETPNQKVTDFVQRSSDMFNEMDYSFSLKKRFKIDPIFSSYLRIAALFVCYILNLYILIVSQNRIEGSEWADDNRKYSEAFLTTMPVLYLTISLCSIIFFYLDTIQIQRINCWSAYIRQMMTISNLNNGEKEWIQGYIDRDIMSLTNQDLYTLIDFKRRKEGSRYTAPFITKIHNDLMFIDRQFFLKVFYAVCYFGGLISKDHLLYSIPLLDTMVAFTKLSVYV